MIGIRSLSKKFINGLLAMFLISAQLFAPLSAIVPTAYASPTKITAKTHQGEKSDLTYTSGNITEYKEGDTIDFRFTLEATHGPTSGEIEVRFTGDDGTCTFFDGSFALGAVTTTGPAPNVTTVGSPSATDFGTSNGEWVQKLNISYPSTFDHDINEAIVNYTLTLSDEAGECNGSSQHSRLSPSGGTVEQTGAQNIPIPADKIIELPEIFVEKWIDVNGDGEIDTSQESVDRKATAGEWSFSLDGGTPVPTDANGNVTFTNVTPDGNHTITESGGPEDQSFLSGSGTNCTFSGAIATASVASGTTAQDATCVFNNGVAPGSIKIIKNALPNNLTNFGFTATGSGVSNFTLDDDNGVSGADDTYLNEKLFSGLAAGDYVITEDSVNGWDLTAISCSQDASVTKDMPNRKVTINLSAGQDVICTFENKQRGQIIVTKQTLPNGNDTEFPVTISTENGAIHSTATQNVTDGNSVSYEVGHGTYDVNETVPPGWSVDESECQDLTINGNTPLVNGIPTLSCTITNTKLAVLIIIKDALPNHTQDFAFTATGTGLSGFNLDDDDDGTLSNKKEFKDLTPNQQYTVTEQSTPGWELTDLTCNDVKQQGSTATVTPTPGQTITCTFTNTKLVSISGTKFEVDADATDGGLGTVLAGWTIFIDTDGDGELDADEQSDVTDESGNYSFSNLLYDPSITITLREVLQSGWTQIFGPSPFTIDSAEDVNNLDFGNFADGSISGYKWNDLDGEGDHDENEPELSNWTIRLYRSDDNTLTGNYVEVDSTTTDSDGNYTFSGLSPEPSRFYSVCEDTQSPAWEQTYPETNGGCHFIELLESGKNYTNNNFGNQGRGGITVNKNVDTDGDGDVDDFGVTNWTWDIADGAQNTATGSSQEVAAGDYTINEDQKENYHFTSVVCTRNGNEFNVTQSETIDVTVNPGDAIVCTFTNTRNTGTITVQKVLEPTNDAGLFDLKINNTVYGDDVSHGEGTGQVQLPTGTYTVSEVAGTNTDLSDYSSSFTCTNGQAEGGTSTAKFTLGTNENVTCTFTNVRYSHIIVEKQTLPDDSPESFDFTANYSDGFSLIDGQQNTSGNLLPGTYSVSETPEDGWDLTSVTCSDQSDPSSISLQAGETVTCTFTNTQRGSISGTKYEVDAEATDGSEGTPLQAWTIFLDENDNQSLDIDEVSDTTDVLGGYSFANLVPGNYTVCEVLPSTWTQIFPATPTCYEITLEPGLNAENYDFGNFENGSISGYKFNDRNGNGTEDEGDDKLPGWTIVLYQDDNEIDNTTTDENGNYSFENLAPGTYVVCEEDQFGWTQTYPEGCHTVEINVSGEAAVAVFGNQGRGTVTVLKNIDRNADGDTDDEEDIIGTEDWTWDLAGKLANDQDISTGELRTLPAGNYTINEDQQAPDYEFTSVICVNFQEINVEIEQAESFALTINPGDDIVCTFTNTKKPVVLLLAKTNNRPDPTVVGDTVTYTLTVEVPEDSGTSYNTTVTDLPPEGFVYIGGSATASKGSLTSPYASPGTWALGNLLPGEVVTLTYQTKISEEASAGTYPDIAYAEGCALPASELETETCPDDLAVLSNVSAGDDSPFVGTDVTIRAPQVLGATQTILVETGAADMWRNLMVGTLLLGVALATLVHREKKGGRA